MKNRIERSVKSKVGRELGRKDEWSGKSWNTREANKSGLVFVQAGKM